MTTPTEARKTALETRLAELDVRLHDIQDELVSHNSADWEELATEREEDEVLEGQGVQGQAEMAAIRAALARIEAGEYGNCVKCGDAISEERLDLLPHTPFCKACAT
ncbi:TraR/DksA family transcriptional regulator [Vannielia litorea]|uniref:TraR/DksA family transcriptional regulator n=1 Tax=Vannielia litorea TaxID=1217970 RepID=UPI001BCE5A99|nr:TraR/DksA C4-type zinc finger protein [Vannielia litorea]MBS8226387.1 TraR/DksA family transcriptional regulator [Vannielia litorea]